MFEVTVFGSHKAINAILSKMEERAQKCSYPYKDLTRDQLESILWQSIEKELTAHFSNPQNGTLIDKAFVVGAPLNDTVFMCTPCLLQNDVPKRIFTVQYSPGNSVYMVDFYVLFDGQDERSLSRIQSSEAGVA